MMLLGAVNQTSCQETVRQGKHGGFPWIVVRLLALVSAGLVSWCYHRKGVPIQTIRRPILLIGALWTCLLLPVHGSGIPPEQHRPDECREGTVDYELAGGEDSLFVVTVPRSGALRFLGTTHTIEFRTLRATLCWNEENPETSRLNLWIAAADLEVTDGEASARRRESVRQEAVGPKVLDAETHPVIHFAATKFTPHDDQRWMITGKLTIQEVTRYFEVEAKLRFSESGDLVAKGEFPLQPEDFGIPPVSVLGGSVRTDETIHLEFTIRGRKSTRETTAP